MLEDVPVHGSKSCSPRTPVHKTIISHQRNLSLDYRSSFPDTLSVPGHQRNRSLDSVLQRIPEDNGSSQDGASHRSHTVVPSRGAPDGVPLAASDDSGIICPTADADQRRAEVAAATTARSRESLDSGADDESCRSDAEPSDAAPSDTAPSDTAPSDTAPISTGPRTKDFLLRLFESKLFDMSMAVSYLFNSKEPGVQSYLGNKLFSFPDREADDYLPQLTVMYASMNDIAEALRPYLVERCRRGADFSARLAWLLEAFGGESNDGRAAKLRAAILAEELRPPSAAFASPKRAHRRSQSDASALRGASAPRRPARHLGDLTSGRAFDGGCRCGGDCACDAPRLAPQLHWVGALVALGRRLAAVSPERRPELLRAGLAAVDLNLPARVWLPLHDAPHRVLRVPPDAAAALNSKERAPFVMYVEVQEADGTAPLPARLLPSPAAAVRHARSEDNLSPPSPPPSPPPRDDCDWAAGDCDGDGEAAGGVRAGDVRRRLARATAPVGRAARLAAADPSARALKESWPEKESRVRASSPYGALRGWRLLPCIVKVGDDPRQELLAAQLLRSLLAAWELERAPLALRPCRVVCLGADAALIEPAPGAVSLHQVKRCGGASLRAWLEAEHGPPTSEAFLRAQRNFVRSAAGYAVASYLLQLKDRHNGNILLDGDGHLIHIDFGFILTTSPKNLGFETSPFKLTSEFVEVMDGEASDMFGYFKILMLQGLVAARKHVERIVHVAEVMRANGQLTCLKGAALSGLRARFHAGHTEAQLAALVERLVRDALNSLSTRLYDGFQYYTNGIL